MRGNVKARVRQVLQHVVDSMEGLERPVVAKMYPVLAQAKHEVERDLMQWLGRKGGEERFTTQRYRSAVLQIQNALNTVKSTERSGMAGFRVAAKNAGELSLSNLRYEVEQFGLIFEKEVRPIAIDPAIVIARGDRLVFKRFASSTRRYVGNVEDTLVRELAVSRVRSETIFELKNRLQKTLPHHFESFRSGAERLARSETIDAYNEFHLGGIKSANDNDDPGLLGRWDASFDARRCPMCASLDGQVRDVAHGEKFEADWFTKSRKGLRHHHFSLERPIAHSNCRCTLVPWRESWAAHKRGGTPDDPWGEGNDRAA